MYARLWWENLRERYYLEDPSIDGRIIYNIKLDLQGCGGRDWIDLAQDRDRWRALVTAVMIPRIE